MYTRGDAEYNPDVANYTVDIYDPDGVTIATLIGGMVPRLAEESADVLLSHLNRG